MKSSARQIASNLTRVDTVSVWTERTSKKLLRKQQIQNLVQGIADKKVISPRLLIQNEIPATPRYHENVDKDLNNLLIEQATQSHSPLSIPTRSELKQLSEYLMTPSNGNRVKGNVGKLRRNLKNLLSGDKHQEHLVEVQYLSAAKPRNKDGLTLKKFRDADYAQAGDFESVDALSSQVQSIREGKSRRQIRMESTAKELLPKLLQQKFPQFPELKPTCMGITQVDASPCLTQLNIRWLALGQTQEDQSARTLQVQRALDRIQKPLRWHFASKLAYLRQAPQLNFLQDTLIR
ncbi:hypothetical protein MP228_008454 [Amoeboaphelidium protococcarum]|nr:hypothetical protein MP228_008454 [Amoeboaphelidium protococcarum]